MWSQNMNSTANLTLSQSPPLINMYKSPYTVREDCCLQNGVIHYKNDVILSNSWSPTTSLSVQWISGYTSKLVRML